MYFVPLARKGRKEEERKISPASGWSRKVPKSGANKKKEAMAFNKLKIKTNKVVIISLGGSRARSNLSKPCLNCFETIFMLFFVFRRKECRTSKLMLETNMLQLSRLPFQFECLCVAGTALGKHILQRDKAKTIVTYHCLPILPGGYLILFYFRKIVEAITLSQKIFHEKKK